MVFKQLAKYFLHCNEYPVTFDVNVRGTFNILESYGAIRLIDLCMLSASVYGSDFYYSDMKTHPYNNRNLYGAQKSCESLMTAYSYQYGLNFIALRYMNVYGPRQDNKNIYYWVVPIFKKCLEVI